MSKPWILINFHCLSSPFVCNLLGISKTYVLWSSNDKLHNFCFINKVFSRGKCWQQFMAQHVVIFTLHIDSYDNTFSILEIEPLESTKLHFFLQKDFFFPSHKLLPHHQHLIYGIHFMLWDALLGSTHQESFEPTSISKWSSPFTQS